MNKIVSFVCQHPIIMLIVILLILIGALLYFAIMPMWRAEVCEDEES